jgi:hypothetical protein
MCVNYIRGVKSTQKRLVEKLNYSYKNLFVERQTHKTIDTLFLWLGISMLKHLNRASSGSIVSGYRLDDWAIEDRSPAGAKDFYCSLCVQTGSGAHSASCTVDTGDPFPEGKARPGRDADHSPPSSTEVENV